MEIAVSDIAKEAGCALGGVYNRFESKDHILLTLAEHILVERVDPTYQDQEKPHWEAGLSVQAFLEIYFTIIAKPYAEYRHIFRPLAMVSRMRKNDEFSRFLHERELQTHTHLTRVLSPLAQSTNPNINPAAISLAVFWAMTLFKDYVLFEERAQSLTGVHDDHYLTELSKLLARYLACPMAGESIQSH